jgi:hypothetical protein
VFCVFLEQRTPWVVPGVHLMSLHLVLRSYKKPVFALSGDLEQGLIVSPYEKGTSILAPVSPYTLQRALKQSDRPIDKL